LLALETEKSIFKRNYLAQNLTSAIVSSEKNIPNLINNYAIGVESLSTIFVITLQDTRPDI
jgi:hypothetical protein